MRGREQTADVGYCTSERGFVVDIPVFLFPELGAAGRLARALFDGEEHELVALGMRIKHQGPDTLVIAECTTDGDPPGLLLARALFDVWTWCHYVHLIH